MIWIKLVLSNMEEVAEMCGMGDMDRLLHIKEGNGGGCGWG